MKKKGYLTRTILVSLVTLSCVHLTEPGLTFAEGQTLSDELSDLQAEYTSLTNEMSKINTNLERKEIVTAEISSKINDITHNIEAVEDSITITKNLISTNVSQIEVLENEIDLKNNEAIQVQSLITQQELQLSNSELILNDLEQYVTDESLTINLIKTSVQTLKDCQTTIISILNSDASRDEKRRVVEEQIKLIDSLNLSSSIPEFDTIYTAFTSLLESLSGSQVTNEITYDNNIQLVLTELENLNISLTQIETLLTDKETKLNELLELKKSYETELTSLKNENASLADSLATITSSISVHKAQTAEENSRTPLGKLLSDCSKGNVSAILCLIGIVLIIGLVSTFIVVTIKRKRNFLSVNHPVMKGESI